MIYPVPKPEPKGKKARTFIRRVRAGARASLEQKATDLWNRVILSRDNFRCRIIRPSGTRCPSVGRDPHHVISRRFKATKWLPENGLTLCPYHHREALLCLKENVIRTIGKKEFDRLHELAYNGTNLTTPELEAQIQSLTRFLNEQKHTRKEDQEIHPSVPQKNGTDAG